MIKGTANVPGDGFFPTVDAQPVQGSALKHRGIAEGTECEKGEGPHKEEIGVLEEKN